MLEQTGRHMSSCSQRRERAFQLCTLSTLHPGQAELGMGKERGWERLGMRCGAPAKPSGRSQASTLPWDTGREWGW